MTVLDNLLVAHATRRARLAAVGARERAVGGGACRKRARC